MHDKSHAKSCKTATNNKDTTLARHRDKEQELFITPATYNPVKLTPSTRTRETYTAKTSEKPSPLQRQRGTLVVQYARKCTHVTVEPVTEKETVTSRAVHHVEA